MMKQVICLMKTGSFYLACGNLYQSAINNIKETLKKQLNITLLGYLQHSCYCGDAFKSLNVNIKCSI